VVSVHCGSASRPVGGIWEDLMWIMVSGHSPADY